MKNNRYLAALLLLFAIAIGIGSRGFLSGVTTNSIYSVSGQTPAITASSDISGNIKFTRNDNSIDFSGVIFTQWDTAAASKAVGQREKKPYTVMVYMNGSDLESEDGAATDDLVQMLESGVNTNLVNIVLFTGGTNRWQNDVIPSNECVIWEIRDGLLYKLTGVGLVNMGDAGTLSGFIDFGLTNFPADKYGLIMWDHGGGSIAGYGHDEKFNKSNLTLLDMNYAFKRSKLSDNKLEFLGFDSCLMATSEMAAVASNYANYLIASEDLEPGGGWDYAFLSAFNKNPGIGGAALGKEIVNSFFEFYGANSEEVLTLSVIDLSKIGELTAALDGLMKKCSDSLFDKKISAFNTLARKRSGTKTFGEGSPMDNDCDMVDIGDMAAKLSDLFPNEAGNVLARLNECVVYNRHNSETDLKGLSVYYIYGGKTYGKESLDLYSALKTNEEHTRYLGNFFNMLVSGRPAARTRSAQSGGVYNPDEIENACVTLWKPVEGEQGSFIMTGIRQSGNEAVDTAGPWPAINGHGVCLYKINATKGGTMYAVPAKRNGNDCDIIVLYGESCPEGKILGSRNEDGLIIQKGFDEIKDGDKIAFYYEKRVFSESGSKEDGYVLGSEFTVSGGLELGHVSPRNGEKQYLGLLLTDIKGNKNYTVLTERTE